ncbi:MAG: porin, partial [Mesorhizobium sp.]
MEASTLVPSAVSVEVRVDARSETELGTLRAYMAFNAQYTTGNINDVSPLSGQFSEQD